MTTPALPSLLTHVRESRRVGGETNPALWIVVIVENRYTEYRFVMDFGVEMISPFQERAIRYEYRSNPQTAIEHLAVNVPGGAISEPIIVIAFFNRLLPYSSECTAQVATISSDNLSGRWEEFTCPPLSPA